MAAYDQNTIGGPNTPPVNQMAGYGIAPQGYGGGYATANAPRNDQGQLYNPWDSPDQQAKATGARRVVEGGFPIYYDGQGNKIVNPGGGMAKYGTNNPWATQGMPPSAGMPPTNTAQSGGQAMNPQSYNPWNVGMPPSSDGTSFGGVQTVGAQAGPADYQGVQQFSDAAYNNARRYLDPQQAFDNRRLQQQYQNQGIDPMSRMGGEMSDQLAMQQGDQDIAAAFAAMGFGQGIQNQMFGQSLANTQQAGNMQQAQWGNELGRGNLQLGRQAQDFNELMGYDAMDFRNANFNEGNNRWDIALAMQMAGMPLPNMGGVSSYPGQQPTENSVSPWSAYLDKSRDIWGG